MDMIVRIDAACALVHNLAYRIDHKADDPAHLVARIRTAKELSTRVMQYCADQAVQILDVMG